MMILFIMIELTTGIKRKLLVDKNIYVVIGCDSDPDRANLIDNLPANTLSWRGMLEGISRAKERLQQIHDSDGKMPVFTWCLRVDYQIKRFYGAYNHFLKEHKDFLLDLEKDGDELGWHPHFWNYDETLDLWYQDCFNIEWQVQMLKEAHAAYLEVFPGRARTVRMGWDYHNNHTFTTLQELGVEVDFSGIPGLQVQAIKERSRTANFFDWSHSPNRPYYPAKADYRREAKQGEPAFSLLESLSFVSKSFIWGIISGLVLAKKMRDPRPLLRSLRSPAYWINITGKPSYFKPLIAQVERTLRATDKIVFVTYFHPDELIDNNSPLYSLDFMEENIRLLVETAKRLGAKTKFIRAREIKEYA
jgi:hypothetical protein